MLQLLSFGTDTQDWTVLDRDAGTVVSDMTPLLAVRCGEHVLVAMEQTTQEDSSPTSITAAFPFCLPIYSSGTLFVAKVVSGVEPGWVAAWGADVEFRSADMEDLSTLQARFQDMSKRDALRTVFGGEGPDTVQPDDLDDAEDERAGGINELLDDDAMSEDGDGGGIEDGDDDDGDADGDEAVNDGEEDVDNGGESDDDDAEPAVDDANDDDIEDVLFGPEDDDVDDDANDDDEK